MAAPTARQAYSSRTSTPIATRSGDYETRRVTEVVNQLRQDFWQRNELYQDIDDVLFGNLPVQIPEAYRKTAVEIRTPLAMRIATQTTAALSVNPFSLQFRPIGFGDTYEQNATLREHFFESSWRRQEEEADRELLRLFLYNVAVKGEGVLKTVERTKRAWGDYNLKSKALYKQLKEDNTFDPHARDAIWHSQTEEMKLMAPYPIATTDVPPETFYYQKGEDGMSYACEVKTLPWFDALERYHAGLDSGGRVTPNHEVWTNPNPQALGLARAEWDAAMSRTKTLTLIESWDWRTCTMLLVGPGQTSSMSQNLGNGVLVKSFKHGYGEPTLKTLRGPYFHCLGTTTASRLPEKAGLSILFGFLALFGLLDSLYTMRGNSAFMTGFPAFKRKMPPGTVPGLPNGIGPYGNDGSEQSAEEEIEPGSIYPYDVEPVEMPRGGPDSDKLIADIRGMVELALPAVAQGIMSGSESGYALNQASHLARLAWDPAVSNSEKALGKRTGFESWLIEKRIGEKVYAWGEQQGKGRRQKGAKAGWLGIGPEDLNGVHRGYHAHLDPETPSNQVIELRAIREAIDPAAPLMTYEDAVEKAGGNPDEVQRSWLAYEYKKTPEMRGRLFQEVDRRLAMREAKQITAPGMPSTAEMAGSPSGPAPGAAPGGMPSNPVPMPGNGLPIQPPPNGVRPPGPFGNPAGTPTVPNLPANHMPLPGQR